VAAYNHHDDYPDPHVEYDYDHHVDHDPHVEYDYDHHVDHDYDHHVDHDTAKVTTSSREH
jgi:hypothetical protein